MHIYTYKIPLCSTVIKDSFREGLLFETDHGWGEAAPLPHYSKETLQETLLSIKKHTPSPSAYFGLRSAQLPFPKSFPNIPVCALATNYSEALAAIENGYQVVKIKVKNHSIEDTLQLVDYLQTHSSISLRIDVNRKWNLKEAQGFFHSVNPLRIEYIEEPLENPSELSQLSSLPIALDETLRDDSFDEFICLPHIKAFVLKPTLLGDLLEKRIQLGQKLQIKLVFSSSFESAIGLLHIAHLQAQFDSKTAVGIDTYRAFEHNFFPISIAKGMLINTPLPEVDRKWLLGKTWTTRFRTVCERF